MYIIYIIYSAIVKLPITGDWLFKEVKYSDFLQNRGKVLEQVLLPEKVFCSAEGVSQLGTGRAEGRASVSMSRTYTTTPLSDVSYFLFWSSGIIYLWALISQRSNLLLLS